MLIDRKTFLNLCVALLVSLTAYAQEDLDRWVHSAAVNKTLSLEQRQEAAKKIFCYYQRELDQNHPIKKAALHHLTKLLSCSVFSPAMKNQTLNLVKNIAEKATVPPWQRAFWYQEWLHHSLPGQQKETILTILDGYENEKHFFGADLKFFKKILVKTNDQDIKQRVIEKMQFITEKFIASRDKLDWYQAFILHGDSDLQIKIGSLVVDTLDQKDSLSKPELKCLRHLLKSVQNDPLRQRVVDLLLNIADQSPNPCLSVNCYYVLLPYTDFEEQKIILSATGLLYEQKLQDSAPFTLEDFTYLSRASRYIHDMRLRGPLGALVEKVKASRNIPSKNKHMWQELRVYNRLPCSF